MKTPFVLFRLTSTMNQNWERLRLMIGRSNRVYEILAGSRPLTFAMIRKLHTGLGIPSESLIGLNRTKKTGELGLRTV